MPRKPKKAAFDAETFAKSQIRDTDEVAELKHQLKLEQRRRKKLEAGTAIIQDAVREALADPPRFKYPKPPATGRRQRGSRQEIAVAHLSDTQVGKVTPTYDSTVAAERIQLFAEKVLYITDIRRSAAQIDELRLYLGGDLVEGEDVFPTQAHQIDSSIFEQALRTTPTIVLQAVMTLLGGFKKVRICAVPGNHGRNGPRGTRSHPKTNWDNVCHEILRAWLMGHPDNPRKDSKGRLEFEASEGFHLVDRVYHWGNLLVHGDQIRGQLGFPWYGAGRKAWGWIDSIPEPWDYLWFGHFHTYASFVLNHRTCLANGTTESDNEYAQANLAACGHPCQRLSFFNEKNGLIADHQVFLTDQRVPDKRRAESWLA